MESWFQACGTEEPFALELVGTSKEQGFLLRASSQAGRRRASEIDEQYAGHQAAFLDTFPFAERVMREHGAVQESKRQRRAAEELATHARTHHFTPGSAQPGQGPLNTSSPPQPAAGSSVGGASVASGTEREAQAEAEQPASRSRNHPRSGRGEKPQAVASSEEEQNQQPDAAAEQDQPPGADPAQEPRRCQAPT